MLNDAVNVEEIAESGVTYSFCTLVTNKIEYHLMISAFRMKGFVDDCEYIYIDNSDRNAYHAYNGYNKMIQAAKGKFLILCHQDILPLEDDRNRLDELLCRLYMIDDKWGCCGNAGVSEEKEDFFCISDPHGPDQRIGQLPGRVMSLDENFIVIRRDANLALSSDLDGYHWYGSDLCIIADVLGFTCYVIDFKIHHKSSGTITDNYLSIAKRLEAKYQRAFRSRRQHVVTRFPLRISQKSGLDWQQTRWFVRQWMKRVFFKTFNRRVVP